MKILLREHEIEIYDSKPHWSGQTKKIYGYTFYGFLRSFRIEGKIRQVTIKNFSEIMGKWLDQDKFEFFVPNQEAKEGIKNRDTAYHLARLCQLTGNMFGEAEDFLEDIGEEFDPAVTIELALELVEEKEERRFFETSRVLYKHLPSYKKRIDNLVKLRQDKLDRFRDTVVGGGD